MKLLAPTLLLLTAAHAHAAGDALRLQDAVQRGLDRYQTIAQRKNLARAADALSTNARLQYLPDLTAGVQQTYGTVNGWYGPQLPIGTLSISSSGPTYSSQSWNSSFGANYLLAGNWEFFTFGRVSARIDLADATRSRADADLEQEQFIHCVRVAGAYLDLLVAQQLTRVATSNLERTTTVLTNVEARAKSGLVPQVDASIAKADVSRATLDLIDARDREQRLTTQLAIFLADDQTSYALDESFVDHQPDLYDTKSLVPDNPQLKFQDARVVEADQTARTLQRSAMPGFNLGAAYQARAGGFDWNYSPQFPDRHTQSYLDGVKPDRENYVVGVTLAWNVASLLKIKEQVSAQEATAASYRNERDHLKRVLENQLRFADERIENYRMAVREVPYEYEAASAAYEQRKLSTIAD